MGERVVAAAEAEAGAVLRDVFKSRAGVASGEVNGVFSGTAGRASEGDNDCGADVGAGTECDGVEGTCVGAVAVAAVSEDEGGAGAAAAAAGWGLSFGAACEGGACLG